MRATLPLPAGRLRAAQSQQVSCGYGVQQTSSTVAAQRATTHAVAQAPTPVRVASHTNLSFVPPSVPGHAGTSPRDHRGLPNSHGQHSMPILPTVEAVAAVSMANASLAWPAQGGGAAMQQWQWDAAQGGSPRNDVLTPIGSYSTQMGGVVRQNSAPGTLSPLRSGGDVAACWSQESPTRGRLTPPRTSESPGPGLGQMEVRAETPRAFTGVKVPVGSVRRKDGAPVGSGRISPPRESSLQRPVWGGRSAARRQARGDEASPPPRGAAVATAQIRNCSPRDDRAPERSSSSSSLRGVVQARVQQLSHAQLPPHQQQVDPRLASAASARAAAEEAAQAVLQMHKEADDMRRENAKLQDKLTKAKNLMVLVQKQADDARAERDRERLKAESLQKSSAQLLRQLKRETAKVQALERMLAAQSRGDPWRHQGISSDGGASDTRSPVGTEQTKTDPHAMQEQVALLQARDAEGGFLATHLAEPLGGCAAQLAEPQSEADADRGSFVGLGDEVASGGCSATTTQGVELAAASRLVGASVGGTDGGEEGLGAEQKSWEYVVQGQHDPAAKPQGGFAAKAVSCYPDDAVERANSRGVVCACARGRRLDASVPNQDDFVAARHTLVHGGHIALYGVLDGHGPAGHHCAAFARGALPESLFGQRTLLLKPEETLREAFRQTQASLLEQPFDTEHSGTTVALALVLSLPAAPAEDDGREDPSFSQRQSSGGGGEAWLFVAHAGDSRAILASHRGGDPSAFTVTALTRDHRPDDPEEVERIRQAGGEVRKLRETSGAMRVFAKGSDRPGLALTRTLGASASAACGVTAEPEVSAYRLRPGVDVLLLLGTDGLFEFCDNNAAAGQLLKDGVSQGTLQDLCAQARDRWAKSSYNETVDDITAIAAMLPNDFGGSTRTT